MHHNSTGLVGDGNLRARIARLGLFCLYEWRNELKFSYAITHKHLFVLGKVVSERHISKRGGDRTYQQENHPGPGTEQDRRARRGREDGDYAYLGDEEKMGVSISKQEAQSVTVISCISILT